MRPRTTSALLFVPILAAVPLSSQVLVDTFAGGQLRSGVPAQEVALSYIDGMAWDSTGNLVLCEINAHRIRRIRPDGIIETIAGNGTTGYSGDGGPATEAALNSPAQPRFDKRGNLYFADRYNYRIRRIDTRGVITTVAGNGVLLEPGMDLEGPALSRPVNYINDLVVGPDGSIYFTEQSGGVRRVTAGGLMDIYAGTPYENCLGCPEGDSGPARSARVANAQHLAADAAGNLYIVEFGSVSTPIRRVAPDGTITRFAGYGPTTPTVVDDEGQPAIGASRFLVSGIGADGAGNIYVVQTAVALPRLQTPGTRIRRIDPKGILTTIAGGQGSFIAPADGPALPSSISPIGLAVDEGGNIAFAESRRPDFVVREVIAQSTLRTIAGSSPKAVPDGTPVRDAWFSSPVAMAVARTGEVYIAESGLCLIRKVANGVVTTTAGTGKCGDAAPARPSTTQDLAPPASIAVDSHKRLVMLDTFGNSYAIGTDGKVAPLAYPPVLGPGAKLTIDSKDRVYVLGLLSLIRISPDGKQETIVSPPTQPGIPPAGFGPTSLGGIGVDPAGNVYFTGSYLGPPGGYIFRVNDDGTFTRLYGGFPRLLSVITRSLAADSNGNVWLTSGPVSVVNASGIWTLGRQEGGDSGDGGPAQSARFNASALSLAPNGDLYVMDNNRVRRLTGLGAAKPAPAIAPGGIVNAASYTGGAIAPGELVSIFGSNFGPPGLTVNLPENNRIPSDLGSTKVLFDGDAGAITAITPTQINVIVPYWVEPGRATSVTVQVDERVSSAVSIPVAKTSPGLSTADRSGSGQGAILNQDGSINSAANPAARGSVVSFFGTGEGRISPQPRWGELSISTPLSKPLEPVSVTIGEVQAEVTYAGSAPLLPAGVFQINARIPGTVASGSARVSLSVGEVSTPKQVTVAVR